MVVRLSLCVVGCILVVRDDDGRVNERVEQTYSFCTAEE